jgi:hypothetical protein
MLMPAPHVPTSRRARAPADHEQQERARETHTGDGTRTRRAIILRIMAPSPAPAPAPARLPARFGRRVRLVASGSGPPPPFPHGGAGTAPAALPSLVSRHGSFPASALPAPRRVPAYVDGKRPDRPAAEYPVQPHGAPPPPRLCVARPPLATATADARRGTVKLLETNNAPCRTNETSSSKVTRLDSLIRS